MSRARPIAVLLVLLLQACGRGTPDEPLAYVAPNLNGTSRDAHGVQHTVSRTLAVIACGEGVAGNFAAPAELAGYEFQAFRGTRPLIELRTEGEATLPALALYGPRNDQGRWGDPLATRAAEGPGTLRLSGPELAAAGSYFVLVQDRAGQGGAFVLQLGCQGNAGPPACPGLSPCDLVCELGFVPDGDGCRTCSCVEPAWCSEERPCPTGQECGEDGRCQDRCATCSGWAPVCGADGQTYANACSAECRGVAYRPGSCPEPPRCREEGRCPAGLVCREGFCVPPDCPECDREATDPVCSQAGHPYRNVCELRCAEEELGYLAECRRQGCLRDAECLDGLACLPVEEERNLDVCRREPRSSSCVRECRPPNPETCGPDRGCPAGMSCYPLPPEGMTGVCLPTCTPGLDAACQLGMSCAVLPLPEAPWGQGVCLPSCSGPGAPCPRGMTCLPDMLDQPACQPCTCPELPGAPPVCGMDNRTYPNACEAICAGMLRFREGACEDQPCICPWEPDPVCGADRVIYNNFCEAEFCAGEREAPLEHCMGQPIALGCRDDLDCQVTGCSGTVCAARPNDACPSYSGEAMCQVRLGQCGCVRGLCQFRQTRQAYQCQVELRGGE